MCLAVPARIVAIEGSLAMVEMDGVSRQISVLLFPEAQLGQYALVHAGFAITVIDEESARETLEAFAQLTQSAAAGEGDGCSS